MKEYRLKVKIARRAPSDLQSTINNLIFKGGEGGERKVG